MNEVLQDLTVLSRQYQSDCLLRFKQYMPKHPLTLTVHARGIGISFNTLMKFLKGMSVTDVVIYKIDNYMNDSEIK